MERKYRVTDTEPKDIARRLIEMKNHGRGIWTEPRIKMTYATANLNGEYRMATKYSNRGFEVTVIHGAYEYIVTTNDPTF